MNTDIRLSVSFKGHRKRKKLRRLLGDKSDSYLIDFWITVSTDCPNGILEGWNNDDIADSCGWEGEPDEIANAFIASGWLDIDTETNIYSVHDWDEHQAWACNSKKRSEAARSAANKRWEKKNGVSMPSACPPHKNGNAPFLSYPNLSYPNLSHPNLSYPKEESTDIKKFVIDYQNYILDKFGNLAPKITDVLIADGIYTIDELIKLDGFTFDEISKALKWAADDEFWSKNVKSLGALRAEGKNGTSKFVNMYTAYKEDDIQKLNPAEKRLQANIDVSRRFLDE